MNEETLDLVHQSLKIHSMTNDERRLEELRITQDKELSRMHFLFRIFGKPCFPRGELVAITGKAKSGKTLFNSILMACCYSNEVLQVQRPPEDGGTHLRCLWYDTEQSEQSTQDILLTRLLPLARQETDKPVAEPSAALSSDAPTPPPATNYDVFNVRSLHYEERFRLFKTAVKRFRPSLVILDGVRDLLADINDGIKAQEIIDDLMKIAQETDCCMVCVLHQNKGVEDRNPRGWLGTELMNKAFEVYSCEKVKPENIFMEEQTHTRKYDLGELLFFRMDEETELPVICDAPTRMVTNISAIQNTDKLPYMNREYLWFDSNNKPHPKMDELFYEALKGGPLFYSDLQTKVQSLLNCGTQMWNNMFREMRDKVAIIRTKNHDGKSVWQLPVPPASSSTPLPDTPDLFDSIAADLGESPSS